MSESLEDIAREILGCTKCRLHAYRTHAVPGEGDPHANVMFVGEAPGRNEDLEGRPFVGAAGRLLTELIESIGLRRGTVFITNVVKCRPPNNRDPREDEIRACSPYLDRQIKVIRPRVLVTLGRHSTRYILGKAGLKVKSIMAVRGKVYELRVLGLKVKVVPTLHPAAALYNPALRKILQEDFKLIKRSLKSEASQETLDAFF